jgi:hypothetical protein
LPSQTEADSATTDSMEHQLLGALKHGKDYRNAFIEESIRTRLTAQIKSMRENRTEPWDYNQFATQLGKKVAWAYRLEDPNESVPTIPTLLNVARTFDVALDVRFIPFSEVIRDVSTLRNESFDVRSFDDELPDIEHSESKEYPSFKKNAEADHPANLVFIGKAMQDNLRLIASRQSGLGAGDREAIDSQATGTGLGMGGFMVQKITPIDQLGMSGRRY